MKRIVVLAVVLFLPLAMIAQVTHQRFAHEGAFATVSAFSAPFTSTNLSVSRTKDTGSGVGVSLQYSQLSESADFSTLTITNMFGPIPASAFTGQNTQNLALSIDTTTLDPTTFFTETCVFDFTMGTLTCGPATGGVIQLNFTENDFVSTQKNDHEVTTSGTVTIRTFQKSDASTANVSGTIFGLDVTGSPANVGVNHNSTLEAIRN